MEQTRGGKREGSGRKPKADEIKLIESMDAICVPNEVWGKLYDKVKDGDVNAIKTWLQYRFGMPKQTVDSNQNVNINSFTIKDALGFDNTKR